MSPDTSFTFEYGPETIGPEGQVTFEVIPPDTKTYSYKWTYGGDELYPLKGSGGKSLIWTAPKAFGLYKINLDVTLNKRSVIKGQQFEIEVTAAPLPQVALRKLDKVAEKVDKMGEALTNVGSLQDAADTVATSIDNASGIFDPDTIIDSAETVVNSLQTLADSVSGTLSVQHEQNVGPETHNQALWVTIRNRSKAIGFNNYTKFIDEVLCGENSYATSNDTCFGNEKDRLNRIKDDLSMTFHGVDAYKFLKTATEVFLLLECGVKIDEALYDELEEAGRLRNWPALDYQTANDKLNTYIEPGRLPYLQRILDQVFKDQNTEYPYCAGVLNSALDCPCLLELIWSYWHEEGGLVQTLNAISRRFQNKRGSGTRDPLAQLEISPLRPLNNLLWGYVQENRERLSISRRASEYLHHYGITLVGKAIPKLRPADNRSKFLEAFHTLLFRTHHYFQEVSDTHVVPDGFPLLNSLKEVHMLLAEGAHNQFGDLPWTSRVEMLIEQWLLARPEMQDFLRGRAMVPYKEAWMGTADTMKKLQGWTDVPVTHFRDLGVYGEQVLLSVRYDDWIDDARNEDDAKNWADYWKPEIQGYMHAYRAATGVDLTNAASKREKIDAKMPAVHLRQRRREQPRSI